MYLARDEEKSQEKASPPSMNTLKPKKGYTTALHRGNNQSWGQLSSRYTYSLGSTTVVQANMRRDSPRVAFLTAHKKSKQSKLTVPETPPALADYSPLSSCFQSFNDDFGHLPRFFNWLLTAEQTIQKWRRLGTKWAQTFNYRMELRSILQGNEATHKATKTNVDGLLAFV